MAAANCGCSRSVAKQKPRCFSPVISGSSTAGAQGSRRDQMPRCASRMSPARMSRSACSSSCALGKRSLGSSSPRKPAGAQPTCVQPQPRPPPAARARSCRPARGRPRPWAGRSWPGSGAPGAPVRRSRRPRPARAACRRAAPSTPDAQPVGVSASQLSWSQVCEPKAWPSAARAFHHGAHCPSRLLPPVCVFSLARKKVTAPAGAPAPRPPAAPRPCGRCRRSGTAACRRCGRGGTRHGQQQRGRPTAEAHGPASTRRAASGPRRSGARPCATRCR
jgi:hypothetical protein